jgi:hypothetical protein
MEREWKGKGKGRENEGKGKGKFRREKVKEMCKRKIRTRGEGVEYLKVGRGEESKEEVYGKTRSCGGGE